MLPRVLPALSAQLVGALVTGALGRCDTPYPRSQHVRLAKLSEESVRRDDIDGDNWPMTWAADDHIYAAYGDGWGCRPLATAPKLNTGLVRISGLVPDFAAIEVSHPWFGSGAEDPNFKACGLLSVGGVLYEFLRYQRTEEPGTSRRQIASKLIWSHDRGRTWENADYSRNIEDIELFFNEPDHAFHSPTFLQAGKEYADASDEFAYIYSPREDRRRSNDNLGLARVPIERITHRAAYEFFGGLDKDGNPTWTGNITKRKPVFTFPGHVSPGDVVFNPPLGRYLLVTCGGEEGGGSSLGIFDAPHPWGPWTTIGYVVKWGSGVEGDFRYDPRIPTKWISEDGLSLVLVYSDRRSSDKLNYQRVTLERMSSRGDATFRSRPAPP